MKPDVIIGIDPDVDKSGFAVLDVRRKGFEILDALTFPLLIEALQRAANPMGFRTTTSGFAPVNEVVVVVEASWLSQKNWHLSQFERKQRAAAKGYDVGRNHETGHKIVEMCRHMGLKVIEHIPLRKCWKGKDRKITHDEITQFIQGLPTHTNQEERDAALLAWAFANLPIRLKV